MDDHQELVTDSEHNALLPYIAPAVRQLDALSQEELENALSNDILRSPRMIEDKALAGAFALLVLLQYRDQRTHHRRDSLNPWDRWSQERDAEKELCAIDKHLERVWERFLDTYCSPKDIEGILWTAFPLEEDTKKPIRVVDFFVTKNPPTYLLSHKVIQYSLFNHWRRGPSLDLTNVRHYLATKYDALCTPRASHAADLLSRLFFFVLLASYTLDPPRKPTIYIASSEYIHVREILLVLFGVSIPWVPLGLPFALTTLAFAFSLPSVPFAGDFSFNVLLISLFLLIFQFHIPVPPSPIYLFSLEPTLPFILLLCHRTLHIFTKVFAFFFPALLISFYLLSLSLADNFLQLQNLGSATPMESRGSFLFFSVVILILVGVSFFALAPVSLPSPVAQHGQLWDVYSEPLGIAARANFVRVLIRYAEPYSYPPPFNLVYFVFIWAPESVLRLLNVTSPIAAFEAFRRTLWRILVGPVFAVVTICIFWLP